MRFISLLVILTVLSGACSVETNQVGTRRSPYSNPKAGSGSKGGATAIGFDIQRLEEVGLNLEAISALPTNIIANITCGASATPTATFNPVVLSTPVAYLGSDAASLNDCKFKVTGFTYNGATYAVDNAFLPAASYAAATAIRFISVALPNAPVSLSVITQLPAVIGTSAYSVVYALSEQTSGAAPTPGATVIIPSSSFSINGQRAPNVELVSVTDVIGGTTVLDFKCNTTGSAPGFCGADQISLYGFLVVPAAKIHLAAPFLNLPVPTAAAPTVPTSSHVLSILNTPAPNFVSTALPGNATSIRKFSGLQGAAQNGYAYLYLPAVAGSAFPNGGFRITFVASATGHIHSYAESFDRVTNGMVFAIVQPNSNAFYWTNPKLPLL